MNAVLAALGTWIVIMGSFRLVEWAENDFYVPPLPHIQIIDLSTS